MFAYFTWLGLGKAVASAVFGYLVRLFSEPPQGE